MGKGAVVGVFITGGATAPLIPGMDKLLAVCPGKPEATLPACAETPGEPAYPANGLTCGCITPIFYDTPKKALAC